MDLEKSKWNMLKKGCSVSETLKEKYENLLTNDCYDFGDRFVIVCEMNIRKSEQFIISVTNLPQPITSDIKPFEECLLDLLDLKKYSDVTLSVAERDFKAHRCILAARSEYFEAMFGTKFKEAHEAVVTIHDVDPDIFEIILRYIYSYKLPNNLADVAADLFVAADQFGLGSLVQICEEQLCRGISKSNYVHRLGLSYLYSRRCLMSHCRYFMVSKLTHFWPLPESIGLSVK